MVATLGGSGAPTEDFEVARGYRMVQTCLKRRLFSVAEAFVRLDQPDTAFRPGARTLRAYLRQH